MVRRLLVLRVRQGEEMYYLGSMSVQELRNAVVPWYEERTGKGYQRRPSKARVNAAKRFIENGGTFPTSILTDVRDSRFKFVPLPEAKALGVDIGWVVLPDDAPIFIVDGQHRKAALDLLPNLENFQVPVVMAHWPDENQEMVEFVTINNNAKSIATDLTNDLLAKKAERVGDIHELMLKGRLEDMRNLKSKEVMDILDRQEASFFCGKLKTVNPTAEEKKEEKGSAIVSRTSMGKSLEPFIKMMDSVPNSAKIASIIVEYWLAVRAVCTEAWEDAENYPYLHNTTGLYIMHKLLPEVVTRAEGDYTEKRFAELLQTMADIPSSEYSLTSDLFQAGGQLKGIGGMGGFNKVANALLVGLAFA